MFSVYNYFYIDHAEVDSIWEQIIHKPEETIVTNKKEQQDNKDVGGSIGGTLIGKIEGHANMMSSNGEERIQKYVNSPTMRVLDLLRYFDGRQVELLSVLKENTKKQLCMFHDDFIVTEIRVGNSIIDIDDWRYIENKDITSWKLKYLESYSPNVVRDFVNELHMIRKIYENKKYELEKRRLYEMGCNIKKIIEHKARVDFELKKLQDNYTEVKGMNALIGQDIVSDLDFDAAYRRIKEKYNIDFDSLHVSMNIDGSKIRKNVRHLTEMVLKGYPVHFCVLGWIEYCGYDRYYIKPVIIAE